MAMERPSRSRASTLTPKKNLGGQPPHKPSNKSRKRVRNLSAAGTKQDTIAACLGISKPTLEKHYRYELDLALPELLGMAVNSLYDALQRGEAWATCFVLKTRGKAQGWSERHEHTGKDGEPLLPPLGDLSDEELRQIRDARRALAKIAPEGASGSPGPGDRPTGASGSSRVH